MKPLIAIALTVSLAAGSAVAQQVTAPWSNNLSLQAQAELAADAARGGVATLEARRAQAETIQQDVGQRRLKRYGVSMTERTIADVPVRIFSPTKVRTGALLLNIHGGGFVIDAGSITENVAIAALTGNEIIAVRYRLAPENPFPAAVDDALAVFEAVRKEHPGTRIGLYGTSAGAVICAQLLARLRADGSPQPSAFGFFSGTADFTKTGDSVALYANPAALKATLQAYVAHTDPRTPALSPARGDLAGWPPTLCIASERDFLLSATANFCRQLSDQGTDAHLVIFDSLPHAFWAYIDAPESDEAFAAMARFFNRQLDAKR